MAGPYYITQADIEARVSARVVRQVFDDDRTGAAAAAAVAQVIRDAESIVETWLCGIYDITEVRAAAPDEMKRVCLDAAVAYMCERWPAYMRRSTAKRWDRLEAECKMLRLSLRRIDAGGTVSPPANVGGTVIPGVPAELAAVGINQIWGHGNTGFY